MRAELETVQGSKRGKRSRLVDKRVKKQVAIYGRYQHIKSRLCTKRLATAHKLWEEADFDTMRLDAHCSEIITTLRTEGNNNGSVRIF